MLNGTEILAKQLKDSGLNITALERYMKLWQNLFRQDAGERQKKNQSSHQTLKTILDIYECVK